MSQTLPPNQDIGRVEIDWFIKRVEDTQHYSNLIQFLMKLDKRFKKDPWVEVRLAQRYFSRP